MYIDTLVLSVFAVFPLAAFFEELPRAGEREFQVRHQAAVIPDNINRKCGTG
jgi:hypothetical protein